MKKALLALLASLAATAALPAGASAATLTTAQARSQYLQDVQAVNKALAPLIAADASVDSIDADRAGVKAGLVNFDDELQKFITMFDNQVADYNHESSETLQRAVAETADLGLEQTADGILVTDLYAQPRTSVDLVWMIRVTDDALVLARYQAAVVADFGPAPSDPGPFHVVAQNTAVGSGADAGINPGKNGIAYTGQQELIVTSTPPQRGVLNWALVCFEAGGGTSNNQGQVNTAFPLTKVLALPVQNAAGGCFVVADATLNSSGSVTIRLAVTGHAVSNT